MQFVASAFYGKWELINQRVEIKRKGMEINLEVFIEGNFLIRASSRDVFNHRCEIIADAGFCKEDSEKCAGIDNVYKLICGGDFNSLYSLKSALNVLLSKKWFYVKDSHLLVEGEEIWSCGEWLI